MTATGGRPGAPRARARGTGRVARTTVRTAAAGVAGAVLLLATSACNGSSSAAAHRSTSPSPSPVVLSGPPVVDGADGVQLRLPAGWHEIPLGGDPVAALGKVVPSRGQVNEILQQIRLGQFRGMRIFAIHPHGAASPDSLNLSISRAQTTTLSGLRNMLELATTRLAADDPQFRQVALPAGQALRVHYRLVNGDTTTQYYLIANTLAYTLTLTTAKPGKDDGSTTDAVARTLRISPAT
jgi:hypothetical protein